MSLDARKPPGARTENRCDLVHPEDQRQLNNRTLELLKLLRGLVLRLALIFRSMEHSISQASSSSKPAMATSLSDDTGRAETAKGSHGKPQRPRPVAPTLARRRLQTIGFKLRATRRGTSQR